VRSSEDRCVSVVKFLGAYHRPEGKIRVVLEYMDRGSLHDMIENERQAVAVCGDGVSDQYCAYSIYVQH
jgi:serine/threonine protein kinase